jgi:hypothetical protein
VRYFSEEANMTKKQTSNFQSSPQKAAIAVKPIRLVMLVSR